MKRELRANQESEKVDIMCKTVPNNYVEDKVALINKMPVVENKNLELNEIRKDIWIAHFLSAKSHMAEKGVKYINILETNNIIVKIFRCNHAGEMRNSKEN